MKGERVLNANLKGTLLFLEGNIYSDTKNVLETVYFLAGILMLITIFIGLRQLSTLKKDIQSREIRESAAKSIEILHDFANNVIPKISEYKRTIKEEESHFATNDKYFNSNFTVSIDDLSKESLAEFKVKQNLGIVAILNYLEAISVSINHGIVNDDLVYDPMSEVFLRFVRNEYLVISISRGQGVPYRHLITLYNKWNKKKQLENINKTQALLDKLKAKISKV